MKMFNVSFFGQRFSNPYHGALTYYWLSRGKSGELLFCFFFEQIQKKDVSTVYIHDIIQTFIYSSFE
jgi:hypothetical protein